jgi:hypothetical protein
MPISTKELRLVTQPGEGPSARSIPVSPNGDFSSENVQDAITEIAAKAAGAVDAVSDYASAAAASASTAADAASAAAASAAAAEDAAEGLSDIASADVLLKTSSPALPAARVVTDTSTVTWDFATAGQAKANVALTGAVEGRLARWGAGGALGQTSSLVENSAGNVGVGVSPEVRFHLKSATPFIAQALIQAESNDANGAYINLRKGRNDGPAVANDAIGSIVAQARDSAGVPRGAGALYAYVGAVGAGWASAGWKLDTTNNAGVGWTRLTVTPDGDVGIGTSSPTQKLDVRGSAYFTGSVFFDGAFIGSSGSAWAPNCILHNAANDGSHGAITFWKSRAGGLVQNGDILLSLVGSGEDGAGQKATGIFRFEVDGTAAAGSLPTRASIYTAPAGSTTAVERARINSAGEVSIGTNNANASRLRVVNTVAGKTALSVAGIAGALNIDYTGGGVNYIDGAGLVVRSGNGLSTWANFGPGTLDLRGAGAAAYNQLLFTNDENQSYQFGMGGSASAQPGKFFIYRSGVGFVMTSDATGNVSFPVGSLSIGGSFSRSAPATKTADFALSSTDTFVIVNKASSCTVTLPAAASWPGREIVIKTIQAQTVVSASSNVVPIGSSAAGTAILPATAGAWAKLVSDGSAWVTMERGT